MTPPDDHTQTAGGRLGSYVTLNSRITACSKSEKGKKGKKGEVAGLAESLLLLALAPPQLNFHFFFALHDSK